MNQRTIILSNLCGLICAILVTVLGLGVMAFGWLTPLVVEPVMVVGLFIFLAVLSLAEIPMMIFSIRQMSASLNPKINYALIITNFGYTFFASVYAVCFILLTGRLWSGALLAMLSLVRFISAMLFVPGKNSP